VKSSSFNLGAAALALALSACAAQGLRESDTVVRVAPPVASPAVAEALPAQERQSTTGSPHRVICRTQGASGTRTLVGKVCKTAAEWEAQRLGAKDELDRHQRPQATR
jgi:hypothetical protein